MPPDPRQRRLLLPIVGGMRAAEASRSAPVPPDLAALPDASSPEGRAEKRLFDAVLNWANRAGNGQTTLMLLDAHARLPAAVKAEARQAEQRRPGDGLGTIIAALEAGMGEQRMVG